MRNYESPKNLTLLGHFCNISTGKYEPDILREEAQYVRWPCSPDDINSIQCKHQKFDEIVHELGGLSFEGRNISNHINAKEIPHIIPEGLVGKYAESNIEYAFFSVRDVLSSHGKEYAGVYHPPRKFVFTEKKILSLPQRTKKILSLSGKDGLIESMTNELGIENMAHFVASLGFDYVIPPDYSAFFGECVGAHRLNQIRSLVFAGHLIAKGVSVIPHIFPSNPVNLIKYTEWLNSSDISLIAVNAQMHKTDNAQDTLLQIVSTLLNAKPNLHILIQGGRLNSLVKLGSLLRRVHITNRTAVHLAMSSTLQEYNVSTDTMLRTRSMEPKPLLMVMNLNSYYYKLARHMSISYKPSITNFQYIFSKAVRNE